ncbi:MAG: hypothetical protein JWO32_2606 [Bacteroidetes bacterium]|nr:hypothetical protein [Bacteroidota bacterium]
MQAARVFTFLFFLLAQVVSSQVFYSINPDYLKSKQEGNNALTRYTSSYPDTSINIIHNFLPRNYMGNVGMPSPIYVFNYGTSELGFRFTPSAYSNDIFKEEEVSYYRSKGPYASLTGIAGSKKMQALKLIFTHTYKDKVNIAVKFNRYTSLGYYLKQQTYTNNLFVSSNYTKANKRSGYYFYFLNNGNKNQENGGITFDTLSQKDLLNGKDLLPVKLTSASRDNKEYKAMFNPWIRLNNANDSVVKVHQYLQLKSKVAFNTYKYKDANPVGDKFYNLIYLDTVQTYDSTRILKFSNEINYSILSTDKNAGVSLGYKNELNQVWQKADSSFSNNLVLADAVWRKAMLSSDSIKNQKGLFETGFNASYIFNGANSGNYKVETKNSFTLNRTKQHLIFLNVLYEKRSADYIYNYWVSNNFIWFNNGYRPQEMFQSQLGYVYNKSFSLTFLFQNIKNYLFFNNVAMPQQHAKALQNAGITANYSIVLLKHIGITVNDIIQSTTNDAYVSVPKNILTARLFYTGSLYHNNLQLQVGAQLQYYQSFYGYGYMPSSQVFYLQDRQMTGEYPYLDVYLNARIRPVNIFLKVENVLQGYAGKSYSFVPGYYQPDRAFRFGISWMFFD